MARCTPYHSVGCLAITFFLLGIGVPFISFSFWANEWADADNFEYYLTKNSQSMVWYDCITTWAPIMPTPTASTTYLLSAPPTYSATGQDFSFSTPLTWTNNAMFMHLLPGSVVTVTFTANTIVNLYIVEGWNNYNSYWHTNPVLSGTSGTVVTTITTADDYYWIFDTGITSFSGRASFNGTKILYDIDPSTIWSSSTGSNTLCVPWSNREKDFWILIQGPQITTDPSIYTNPYPFELVWQRRWSFIGPLMAGIFLIVGLIIPAILVVVMRKFMRHPSTYDDVQTEYSTYSAAPSYTAAPVYTQPPAAQYGGYQQPSYNQPAPYSQQVAPSYGQQAFSQQQSYQPYNNNPPKY